MDPQLLTDIRLDLVDSRALSIYRTSSVQRRAVAGRRGLSVRDFATVTGRDNLAQAVALRLLTPRGELAALGHADYGSRLPELIGSRNTDTTRNLAKLYVIESLKQERRIEKIVDVEVRPHPGTRHRLDIAITVKPIGEQAVLELGPFTIEL